MFYLILSPLRFIFIQASTDMTVSACACAATLKALGFAYFSILLKLPLLYPHSKRLFANI